MIRDNVSKIKKEEIESFKELLIAAMKKEGATKEDFEMFTDDLLNDIIITAILNRKDPEQIAWAILQ